MNNRNKNSKSLAPVFTLMILAPLITEVLPGATRFSALFVFPIEICVWGGGALIIRYFSRKLNLNWIGMLFLALALSVTEEFLIQQSSLAPLVIHIKGTVYARALGVNYVYLLWALIYESVSVVIVPVYLTELIFPERKNDTWISRKGLFVIIPLFLLGSFLAWFTWTQIARPKVFHVPAYHPPVITIILASLLMIILIFTGTRFTSSGHREITPKSGLPAKALVFVSGAVWSALLFGLVLVAFDLTPALSPMLAVTAGLLLAGCGLYLVPRWNARGKWNVSYKYSLIFGVMTGSMLVSFVSFIGVLSWDLYFKIIIDLVAIVLMILLGVHIKRRSSPAGGNDV